jgi:predicted metal-dependent hydrolase
MWKAEELFECLKREATDSDLRELFKAFIAYITNIQEYTDDIDEKMEKVVDTYYDTDYMCFLSEELYDTVDAIVKGETYE